MPKRKAQAKRSTPTAKKSGTGKDETSKQATKTTKKAKVENDSGTQALTKTVMAGPFSLASLISEKTWSKALADEMKRPYFTGLEAQLAKDYGSTKIQIFPSQDLIFNALNLTPLDQVKVVILGQDPYHDYGQAHGLAFSVPPGVDVPPSLRNMFKELVNDVSGFKTPPHGCLEKWAQQGVLLLNATLTVEAHKPNSHKSYGWHTFTDEVIRTVSDKCDNVVFLLWGNFAHKKEKLVDSTKHTVLKDAHPSPLSFGKFSNCKCFSRANEVLQEAAPTVQTCYSKLDAHTQTLITEDG